MSQEANTKRAAEEKATEGLTQEPKRDEDTAGMEAAKEKRAEGEAQSYEEHSQ